MSFTKNNNIYNLKKLVLHRRYYTEGTMKPLIERLLTEHNLYFQNKCWDLPENISQTAPNINMNTSAFTYHWFAYTAINSHGHVNPQNLNVKENFRKSYFLFQNCWPLKAEINYLCVKNIKMDSWRIFFGKPKPTKFILDTQMAKIKLHETAHKGNIFVIAN